MYRKSRVCEFIQRHTRTVLRMSAVIVGLSCASGHSSDEMKEDRVKEVLRWLASDTESIYVARDYAEGALDEMFPQDECRTGNISFLLMLERLPLLRLHSFPEIESLCEYNLISAVYAAKNFEARTTTARVESDELLVLIFPAREAPRITKDVKSLLECQVSL